MKMRVGAAALASAALLLSACAANEGGGTPGGDAGGGSALSGTLAAAGASSMASAQEAWVAQFQTANPDVTVNYSPDGSGAGREAFTGGGVDWAGSDRAMKPEEVAPEALASSRCAEGSSAMNLPVYISPIALIYNIEGVDSLQLDAPTIAKIFKGEITKWNDKAIADQNPGTTLPDLQITAVHRADDSGTTENFTDYLNAAAPKVWDAEPDGEWPYKGGEAAPQTSGMVDAVTNGTGTIGYADASRAGDLGVVKVKVGDKYLEYSPEAASAIVTESPKVEDPGLSPNDQSIEIDRNAEGDVYPIVLVSYAIACDQYKDPKTAELVKAYLSYIASPEGQQEAVKSAGIAPLSDETSQAVATSLQAIK
ncbi:phosphate ABC transporter substrate-binding protein PstS [Naumannella cuiyingiana]|uniref:Phosphate-binding protein n=1 Tax=Naumannella cuiyingiana TaxID=1347891 RepID=A0A7Z0ILG5_9ACTN|nr:phosphate ABC transporter substrate-binding protein PstS [Naumannella cuiyingiana]NYI71526.1 phosphate transport system substrate-binding protein [Naumannella cuiyingiana]